MVQSSLKTFKKNLKNTNRQMPTKSGEKNKMKPTTKLQISVILRDGNYTSKQLKNLKSFCLISRQRQVYQILRTQRCRQNA